MQKTQNLQESFLNQLRRERALITVFLVNGFQLHGVIRAYDGFTVVLDSDGRQQLIYKHAISTIIPPRPVELQPDAGAGARDISDTPPAPCALPPARGLWPFSWRVSRRRKR